jgi:hypothetical protein
LRSPTWNFFFVVEIERDKRAKSDKKKERGRDWNAEIIRHFNAS